MSCAASCHSWCAWALAPVRMKRPGPLCGFCDARAARPWRWGKTWRCGASLFSWAQVFDFGVLIHDTPSRNLCCLFPTWGLADLASPFRGFEKKATIIGSKKSLRCLGRVAAAVLPPGLVDPCESDSVVASPD